MVTFEIEGFTPLGVLGQGGFGTVHRAADDAHGREVAVKVLGRITDDSARRRFDRGHRSMGTLSGHPTIGVVDTSGFTENEEPYIVMAMIRGGSLADRLEKVGPLPRPKWSASARPCPRCSITRTRVVCSTWTSNPRTS